MGRMTRVADQFVTAYPNIARWVREEEGWIEVGSDEFSASFIRVLNAGGMVWEGNTDYPTMDAAFSAADAGIAKWRGESVAPPASKKRPAKRKKPAGVKMVAVDSSMLSEIGYDDATKELVARFNSGVVWRYRGVPKHVYRELLASDSKGGYMRDLIIGAYPEYRAGH